MAHSYLLADIPPRLRWELSKVAAKQNVSIQNLVLATLYEHYSLEAPARQRERTYSAELDQGSTRMVIRGTPELFDKVRDDAVRVSGTMRMVIIDILAAHFRDLGS